MVLASKLPPLGYQDVSQVLSNNVGVNFFVFDCEYKNENCIKSGKICGLDFKGQKVYISDDVDPIKGIRFDRFLDLKTMTIKRLPKPVPYMITRQNLSYNRLIGCYQSISRGFMSTLKPGYKDTTVGMIYHMLSNMINEAVTLVSDQRIQNLPQRVTRLQSFFGASVQLQNNSLIFDSDEFHSAIQDYLNDELQTMSVPNVIV